MSLEIGLKGRADDVVTPDKTAAAVGSGLVPVFATPYMVALMEGSAVHAVTPYLSEGEGTVGTFLNVTHDAATPVGMKVWAECELTQVDGRALTFTVTAYDECGVIGKGTHGRFIIKTDRFVEKTNAKLQQTGV
jgi:fluoroacetyl-CoA thioesterase